MIGSAMRNPRIQPGNGSVIADSMMDGRTIVSGTAPLVSTSAASARALVSPYESGKPREADRARPTSTSRVLTQRWRICSRLALRAAVPAAPSSASASAANSVSRSGVRLSSSTESRLRRTEAASARQSTATAKWLSESSSSGANPRRLPAT